LLELTEEQDEMISANKERDVEQDQTIARIDEYNQTQDQKMEEHRKHLERMIAQLETKLKE
jgi:multidrug efflux pump subunit AcrA (membrane-fusion protein)